ncbi:MAG: alpha/beta hydrolase [Candidatus Dormibacteria bacterium]
MTSRSHYLIGSDGLQLHYLTWTPEKKPRWLLIVAHGQGEHAGRYENLADHFVPRGAAIYAIDHRGHGRSAGPRGHVADFAQYVSDLNLLVELARAHHPGVPAVLIAHSYGGAIGLKYLVDHPDAVDLAIVSSPMLRLRIQVPGWRLRLARGMARVYPRYSERNRVDPAMVSRDPDEVRRYAEDPLVHDRITAGAYMAWMAAASEVMEHARDIRTPVLLVHGGSDPILDTAATEELHRKLEAPGSEIHLYPGLLHEPFNELGRDAVFADMEEWLVARSRDWRPLGITASLTVAPGSVRLAPEVEAEIDMQRARAATRPLKNLRPGTEAPRRPTRRRAAAAPPAVSESVAVAEAEPAGTGSIDIAAMVEDALGAAPARTPSRAKASPRRAVRRAVVVVEEPVEPSKPKPRNSRSVAKPAARPAAKSPAKTPAKTPAKPSNLGNRAKPKPPAAKSPAAKSSARKPATPKAKPQAEKPAARRSPAKPAKSPAKSAKSPAKPSSRPKKKQ